MAEQIFTDAYVSINSVDLSDHVKSVSLEYSAEMHDNTAMGDTTRSKIAGFKNWSVTVEFMQDYASGAVDATLFPRVGDVAFPIAVRPVKGSAISATNPEYQGNAVLEKYEPMKASIGELGMVSVTFQSASTLTRDVTP